MLWVLRVSQYESGQRSIESAKPGKELAMGPINTTSSKKTTAVAARPDRPPTFLESQRNAGYMEIVMIIAQNKTLTNGATIIIDHTAINAIKPNRMMLFIVLSSAVILICL
jgi:hypothetical protein